VPPAAVGIVAGECRGRTVSGPLTEGVVMEDLIFARLGENPFMNLWYILPQLGEQETPLSPMSRKCQRMADGRKRCGDKSLTV
jgi:hypothetical protein